MNLNQSIVYASLVFALGFLTSVHSAQGPLDSKKPQQNPSALQSYSFADIAQVSLDFGDGPTTTFLWTVSGQEKGLTGESEFEIIQALGYSGHRLETGMVDTLAFMSTIGWEYIDTQFYPDNKGVSMRRLLFRKPE